MSGSALQTVKFTGKKVELPDWWAHAQEGDPVLQGLEPGVLVEDRRHDNQAEAQRHVSQAHQPGHKALAVSFYAETADTVEGKKLRRQLGRVESQAKTVLGRGLKSLSGGKSPLVACKNCKSRLARGRLQSVFCPLCGAPILSPRRRERLEKLRQEAEALKAELQDHPPGPRKGGPVHWLVGGWSPREQR